MMTLVEKIARLRQHLVMTFPERQHVVDGMLAAALAGEHVLLLGPPGTGKSALCRAVARAFDGSYFERLLTKFTTPDEIFGPMSLRALEDDRFERVVSGKLPTVQFGFLDEVFLANSAILNSLLTLMNERLFHNDGAPLPCPLVCLFGASNSLPEGRDLEALFDRFLLRFDVEYLAQPANLRRVLLAPDPSAAAHLSLGELRQAQTEAAAVAVPEETVEALLTARDHLRAEGIVASDRRWKKALKVARASAYILGEDCVSPEHLLLLVDCLWREPRERSKVARTVGRIVDPVASEAEEVLESARETSRKLASLRGGGDKAAYVSASVKAIDEFKDQQNRLGDLTRKAGRRARQVIEDAQVEVQGMHAAAKRAGAESLGIVDRVLGAVMGG